MFTVYNVIGFLSTCQKTGWEEHFQNDLRYFVSSAGFLNPATQQRHRNDGHDEIGNRLVDDEDDEIRVQFLFVLVREENEEV